MRWYWCLEHDRVESDEHKCRAADRLGPYATHAEATAWRERVEARNERWAEQDEAWADPE